MTREEALSEIYSLTDTVEQAEVFIHKIYDDFENRTCNNCKFYVVDTFYNLHRCQIIKMVETFDNFGCNKWEKQQ